MSSPHEVFVPSDEVVISIVLPTIIFCIGMVVAMIVGINKCKQWELDKIVEMRRTRRVVQRITARLREKNFNTIQRARRMRKRAKQQQPAVVCSGKKGGSSKRLVEEVAPPLYTAGVPFEAGTSPPPSYEDALLDDYYLECLPPPRRSSSRSVRSSHSSRGRRCS